MVIYKFGASWCSGCLVMQPRFARLEEGYKQNNCPLETYFFDVDNEDENTKKALNRFNITITKDTVIPIFIFTDKTGKEVKRFCGEVEERDLILTINELLTTEGITPPDYNDPKKSPWWKFW